MTLETPGSDRPARDGISVGYRTEGRGFRAPIADINDPCVLRNISRELEHLGKYWNTGHERSLKVMWELASLLDHDKCAIDVV